VSARKNLPIAFQGARGAFSEEAARKLLGQSIEDFTSSEIYET